MKNIRPEVALWIQTITLIVIWALLLYFSTTGFVLDWEAARKIPEVVLLYGVLYFIFTKWLWRWSWLNGWLIPLPDLQGTWKGTLTSTWTNATTGAPPSQVPVLFVIRQSFSTISCTVHTHESISVSVAASFEADKNNDAKRISYVYTNTPRVPFRDRSVVHDGAAVLRVVSQTSPRLEGEYWTNRKTTGEMTLTFRDRELAEAFSD